MNYQFHSGLDLNQHRGGYCLSPDFVMYFFLLSHLSFSFYISFLRISFLNLQKERFVLQRKTRVPIYVTLVARAAL
jgi:hypothetical protein